VVVGKRGRAYLVKVKMGGKYKTIVAKSEHLLPVPV
jgi:ribosomal protein L21E